MIEKILMRSLPFFSILICANMSLCSQEEQHPLHQAAAAGDLVRVRSLFEQGAPLNAVRYDHINRQTALHLAAEYGHLQVVEFLAGIIDLDARNGRQETPLYLACDNGHLDVAKYLIEHGADINAADLSLYTPLHCACSYGHLAIVNFLVQNEADIHVLNNDTNTPLHCAAKNGHHYVVAYLCAIVSQDHSRYNTGTSPLHSACWNLRVQTAKILVECGANVNAADDEGSVSLHYAVAADSTARINHNERHPLISYLLSQGAQIDAVDDDGDTVVHRGICTVSSEVIKLLWECEANFDLKNDDQQTPVDILFEAIQNTSEVDRKKELLEKAAFMVRFGIIINKKHKKVLEAENQALHEQWAETATNEQKKQMITRPRPIYLQLIQEEKERLLKHDLAGTYVEALPRDLQGLVLKFVVSQTESKRARDCDSADTEQSNKKHRS